MNPKFANRLTRNQDKRQTQNEIIKDKKMSAITNTNQIVDQMKQYWIFTTTSGQFYFGYPSEVDNIHNKQFPLMIMNPPTMTLKAEKYNNNVVDMQSNWTFTIYANVPSTYNVTDDLKILDLWDTMENDCLRWLELWWRHFEAIGNDLVMTSPMQITRIKESSNDRLLGLKCTLGFNFFRYCNIDRI